jgi:hypothetical protein
MNDIKEPDHYKRHGVECKEYTVDMSFTLGNALKYIWRCDKKGSREKDLEKALEYLDIDKGTSFKGSCINMTDAKIERLKDAFKDDINAQTAAFAIMHADLDTMKSGREHWRELARKHIVKMQS